jgi:hypothetical protein
MSDGESLIEALPEAVEREWRRMHDEYNALRRERSQALYGHTGASIGTLSLPVLGDAVRNCLRDLGVSE